MNNSSGTRRSRVLVTITPYNEQEKRVTSTAASTTGTATTTTTTASIPPPPAPPPLPLTAKTKNPEDSVEMQSIESFKLKETPNPVIPKPPPTYFPVPNTTPTSNGSPRHVGPVVKPQVNGKEQSSPVLEPGKTVPSPTGTGKPGTGKVAIRIGAYEGEAKQPSRLDFLSQQPRSDKNAGEELANGPVVSRLQNELAATLQRSNLRRKTDGESQPAARPIPENVTSNGTTNSEPNKPTQSNVEKLASALSNKVTIKVNPDNNSR